MQKILKHLPIALGLTFIWLFNNTTYVIYPQWQYKWLLICTGDAFILVISWLLTKRIIAHWRKRFGDRKNALKRNAFIFFQQLTLALRYTFAMYIGDLLGLWKGLFDSSYAQIPN